MEISTIQESSPMGGVKLAAAVLILSLATFIVILDATIINVAIPHIAGSFAASPSEGTWAITAYVVAESLTIPLTGWLAERFGAFRTLLFSTISFAVFSAVCGIAPTLQFLVIFRVLQGLSGGPLIPISQTIIIQICPRKNTEMVMGLWMMTSILAPIAGPILGGTLADTLGWRWAFFLNVPVALLCAFFAYLIFRGRELRRHLRTIDLTGLVLLVIWVASLQIMLDNGEERDWFASESICALMATSLLSFLAFIIWELTRSDPIVDLRVFRHRGFAVSAFTMFFAFGTFFASIVLMPLWLQLGMAYTATAAGWIMAYQGMLGIIAAPVAAALMPRVDPRILMSSGLAIISGAIFYRSQFTTDIGYSQMILPQLALGIGLPLFFVPIMTISLKSVPLDESASASGLINFLRTIAASIATAIVVALWKKMAVTEHAYLTDAFSATNDYTVNTYAGLVSQAQSINLLDSATWQQSMVLAFNAVSQWLALVLALAAVGLWAMPKQRKN